MKVTSVERILLDIPFNPEAECNMPRQVNGTHIVQVCRVTTDNGLVGYGETLPSDHSRPTPVVTDGAIQRVIGQNPFDLMWDDSLGGGLQMALFDLAGKAAEVPIYRLLGDKVRDWCPISWFSIDMPPADLIAEVKNAVAQGYTWSRIKARPWFDIREQVAAICGVVPPTFHLTIDLDSILLDAASAMPVVKDLEQFANVSVFKQPIPEADIAGNRRLRAQTRCAIMVHSGVPAFMTILREDTCDGFIIRGGASQMVRRAAVLAEANKPFCLQFVGTGITAAFTLHFGAVLSHARWPAVTMINVFAHQLLREPLTVQGGYCRVPEAPGLGVAIDEGALEKFTTSSSIKENLRAVYVVIRPNGERTQYASVEQCIEDFRSGNQPVFEPGVCLEVLPDDGSAAWAELYRRVRASPLRLPRGL